YNAVGDFMRRTYSVSKLLCPFFSENDVPQFVVAQCKSGTMIIGSIALSYFTRDAYINSDLDLLVNRANAVHMRGFLISMGYALDNRMVVCTLLEVAHDDAPINLRFPTLGKSVKSIESIETYRSTSLDRVVRLVMCVREEIEVILGLHSTCTMNFITHARAYSLYPRATLDYHASASRFTTDERELEAQVKYRQRGWVPIPHFIVDSDVIHDSTLDFPDVDRFVGDQYTL
ncbi:uncharacterized protein EV420DRAFT_1279893, partial [Desarmillaria tabescens]